MVVWVVGSWAGGFGSRTRIDLRKFNHPIRLKNLANVIEK
jgi:hypothetical protein